VRRDILVVDDETDIRGLVSGILEDEGYEARGAADSDQTMAAINHRVPALVLLDIWLQGSKLDGLALLDWIRKRHAELPVLIISGHGNIETAVAAIKRGAYDFIEKPFTAERLLLAIGRALEQARIVAENRELRLRAGHESELIGNSNGLMQLRQQIDKVAPTNSRVLFNGPPGSGKELCARILHARSRRGEGPFRVLPAATLSPERFERALFGEEGKGANGERQPGILESAHHGTLFIDEIVDLPLETQGKILRALVDSAFERPGVGRVKVDVRVVSASARDLKSEIAAGRLRADLYHRLAVVPVKVPALAERREDVAPLAKHFMVRLAAAAGLPARTLADDALVALQGLDWPGNVRQLRNVVEQLLILAPGSPAEPIRAAMLPAELTGGDGTMMRGAGEADMLALPLREARELFERQYLIAQMTRFSGNVSRTANFVGMERSALHRKLKSLGVHARGEGVETEVAVDGGSK